MRWDMEVAWADGTRLLYNPRFSRSRPKDRRSYSVPLRPDIALQIPIGPNAGLHLFDAKFKRDKIGELMPAGPVDDEPLDITVEERRGTFKRGDLYKMHAYRDAIGSARSVWILYPGSEFRFYSPDGDLQTSPPKAGGKPVEGVGAIPLSPGHKQHEALVGIIACLTARVE